MINKMKRHVILGISLLLAGIAGMTPAGVQAASMAVLVVGLETDAASDMFAAGIRYEFTQKGYTMATTPAVAAKLKELRDKHAGGQPVDTAGLAAWGKENSIDFVQLVVESDCTITIEGVATSGREQLAQVVRCGAEQYSGRGYYRTRFIPQPQYDPNPTPNIDPNPNLGTGYEEMVAVTGGVFQMSTNYYVALSGFYIGKYEVTQGLWKKVMGSNPSNFSGDSLPVERVSWDDINGVNGFLETLNAMTGKNYRLATEAEWAYAARGCKAGVCDSYAYSGSNTLGDVAWYNGNCSSTTHAVGTKAANGLGLYDMSGNVDEWCYDLLGSYPSNTSFTAAVNPTGAGSGSDRVVCNGGWDNYESACRIAFRVGNPPNYTNFSYGFRLV
jgi:formylglycine-generating enzyme required for sulfatase activity